MLTNRQRSLIKVKCSFFLWNKLSICTTTRKIMQVQTLANLRCVKFDLKLISPNIPNLNIKEASTSHEFKFVLGTYLHLQHGTSRNF